MRRNFFMLLAALCVASTAWASGGGEMSAAPYNAKWKAECGACHVAYPAKLLPAASWKAVMAGLDKHFGTDASLDAATAAEIQAFLEKNASRRKVEVGTQPPLRITETRWFHNEHGEVAPSTWKNPQVKSPANCAACHTKADTGDYNEHNIRVPR